ncbi:hypothetical protein TNCV_1709791 [Trichonephila clavipes]|nr:hypothetical protein TNCV_1709791 [Trichonephila clavipes]
MKIAKNSGWEEEEPDEGNWPSVCEGLECLGMFEETCMWANFPLLKVLLQRVLGHCAPDSGVHVWWYASSFFDYGAQPSSCYISRKVDWTR